MGNCIKPVTVVEDAHGKAVHVKQQPARRTSLHKIAKPTFYTIRDNYNSIEQVQEALRKSGLEASQLIIGVDFTKSNTWTGKESFGGKCLHYFDGDCVNPYQRAISIIGRTLAPFDDDNMIPTYGFGDAHTTDKDCFSFFPNDRPCMGFEEVLVRYSQIAPGIALSGPTNFAPLIYKAIEIVKQTRSYHILVILADGLVTNKAQTIAAIEEASKYALSIVMVGVGDGPWHLMEEFDDALPQRAFDNFQFVPLNARLAAASDSGADSDAAFAMHALMECPEQYKLIQQLGYL